MKSLTKLTLIAALVALLSINFAFSQENNNVNEQLPDFNSNQSQIVNTKPASRVGLTMGLQIPDDAINNGFGVTAFYHHTLSNRWFLSFNVGYHYYSVMEITEGSTTAALSISEIPITLGINFFLSRSGLRPYLGLEVGYVSSKGDADIYGSSINLISGSGLVIAPSLGFSLPVSKVLSVEGNIRFGAFHSIGVNFAGINAGVSYLIP
jgi:outer membrane protein W